MYSCDNNDSNIFKNGRTWDYSADFINKEGQIEDSVQLKLTVEKNYVALITNQIPIIYRYSINGSSYKEPTGAIDDKNEISIHNPRLGVFSFTEVLPMPSIVKPIGSIYKSSTETSVSKSTMKALNGKVVKQSQEFVGKDSLVLFGEKIPCFKIKVENTNLYEEVGHYSAIYWYSEEYGFIRLLFMKPNGESVDMKLLQKPYFLKND